MKAKLIFTYLLVLICTAGYTQVKNYTYKRELKGVKDQWHVITLPNEIFKEVSADLSDLRIYGHTKSNDTLETPYILQLAAEKISEVETSFKLINQIKVDSGYYFTFEVPISTSVNQINFDFKEQNFDWLLSLDGSQDLREWYPIIKSYRILSINNDQADYKFTKVTFPDSKYRYIRLFINSKKTAGLLKAKLSLNHVTEGNFRSYAIDSSKIIEDKQNKRTIIGIDLTSRVPVSSLSIPVNDKYDFYRPVTITYLLDSFKTEKGWKYNYKTLLSGTLSSIEDNEFKFNSTLLKKLRIIIENQDNEPLQIGSVTIKGYVHELIARFNKPGTYYLVYGNNKAGKPSYDINRFSDKIPTSLAALNLGKEQLMGESTTDKTEPLFQNKAWLWLLMGVIILLLGWFTMKMIRQK